MSQSLCILGRLPALSIAELESLFGADKLRPVSINAAVLDIEHAQVDFSRLGGTVKFCKVLTYLETTNWRSIEDFLKKAVPEHASNLPEGKLRLGLSAYGLNVSPKQLTASGLALKKVLKARGRSARVVPNVESDLNAAQVLHNSLTNKLGWELIFVRDGNRTICAQTIAVQDIIAYTKRDQARPKRDARVGMLPPKLAQTIINLAAGRAEAIDPTCGPVALHKTVLDPFCGTGVVLQEALLMGYDVFGTDLESRMVEFSKTNLEWLRKSHPSLGSSTVEVGDATNYVWEKAFDLIAAETYLGRPFSSTPTQEVLEQVVSDVNVIHKKFLQNLAKQTKPGFRLCLAVPAWKTKNGFRSLPMVDHLTDMGYTRVSFVHAKNKDLIYFREGQVVARELLVLQRR